MLWVDIIGADDRLDAGAFILLKFDLILLFHALGGLGVLISIVETSRFSPPFSRIPTSPLCCLRFEPAVA